MLIEVKVKVARKIDGKIRKRPETYVVDKEVFAEAEMAVMTELTQEQEAGTVENFEIQSLRISSVKEIDEQTKDNALPSFMATLRDLFLDDEGNEKQRKYKVLLWAATTTDATARANALSHQGYDMLVEGIKQVDYIYLD